MNGQMPRSRESETKRNDPLIELEQIQVVMVMNSLRVDSLIVHLIVKQKHAISFSFQFVSCIEPWRGLVFHFVP